MPGSFLPRSARSFIGPYARQVAVIGMATAIERQGRRQVPRQVRINAGRGFEREVDIAAGVEVDFTIAIPRPQSYNCSAHFQVGDTEGILRVAVVHPDWGPWEKEFVTGVSSYRLPFVTPPFASPLQFGATFYGTGTGTLTLRGYPL